MNYLSLTGLTLDLLGVLSLGVDLIVVQRQLKNDAAERVCHLEAILDEIGGIDGWAVTVESDFRDWQWEEGRALMISGSFNADTARQSFQEVLETVAQVGAHVTTLARMQAVAVKLEHKTARRSLGFSYLGIGLIVIGFSLQLPAYL